MVVHAEVNAILGAGTRARGGTVYVFGKPICARCAGSLIQAGIKRVISAEPQEGTGSKWDKSGKLGHQMMAEAGLALVSIPN